MSKDTRRFGDVHKDYKGLCIVPYTTYQINEGGYFLGTFLASFAASQFEDFLIETPSDSIVHFAVTASAETGPVICSIHQSPVETTRTPVISLDMNRQIGSGLGLIPRTLINRTVFASAGLTLASDSIPSNSKSKVFTGETGEQFKLNNNSVYGFRIQNFSDAASVISVLFHFSEHLVDG